MAVLNASAPALKPPFATRRCAWSQPDLLSHKFLVLTSHEIILAPVSCERSLGRLEDADDEDLIERLGSQGSTLPIASIRNAKLDLLQNALFLEHDLGRVDLKFGTAKAADACFSQIWRRLGASVRLNSPRGNRWAVARLPLTVLGAILAITAALALSIFVVDSTPAAGDAASLTLPGGTVTVPASLNGIVGWMDWRVICGLGGIGAAIAQMWLYRRITRPPVSLELTRSADTPRHFESGAGHAA